MTDNKDSKKSQKLSFPLSAVLVLGLVLMFLYFRTPGEDEQNVLMVGMAIFYLAVAFFSENQFLLPKVIQGWKWLDRLFHLAKYGILLVIIAVLVFAPPASEISWRLKSPDYNIMRVHDGIIQTEEAVKKLLAGKNPYSETYHDTVLAKWITPQFSESPALYHYVYFPFKILVELPFFLVIKNILGTFDGRIVLFFAQIGLLFLLPRLARREDSKLCLLALYFLNPMTAFSFVWGHDDLLMFFWLVLAVVLLLRRRTVWAGIPLALACGIKPQALFFVPFYFAYLCASDFSWANIRKKIFAAWPFWLTLGLIFLPFIAWNPKAFYDSTVGYLSGTGPNSYKMMGNGISFFVAKWLGPDGQFPFLAIQLGLSLPMFAFFLFKMKRNPSLRIALYSSALIVFFFHFFSRYFFLHHLYIVIWILMVGYFIKEKPQTAAEGT